MGGLTELSTAIPCGANNSRPSTRLGASSVRVPICCSDGWPTIRDGNGLNTVCALISCAETTNTPNAKQDLEYFIRLDPQRLRGTALVYWYHILRPSGAG